MKIYVASSLENAAHVRRVQTALIAAGHTITYDWTVHGSVWTAGPARIREVAEAEHRGVVTADAVVVLLPGARGTHIELGIALGAGVPVILVGEQYSSDGREPAFYFGTRVRRITSDVYRILGNAAIVNTLPYPLDKT